MTSPLVENAIEYAWANPQADRQHVLRLARVSRDVGAMNHTRVMRIDIPLPTREEVYHVFQIGQNHPWEWNFGERYVTPIPFETWVPLTELNEKQLLVSNVYMDNGVQFPNAGVYVRLRYDHNIIVAIKPFANMTVPRNVQVYLRVYSNAYLEDAVLGDDAIQNFGGVMTDATKVLDWQNRYLALKQAPGLAQAFVNGVLVDDFPPGSYRARDWVDVRYDATVRKVVDLNISDLPSFMSTQDKKRKYIVHPPRGSDDFDVIYHDDIDFWLIGPDGKGIYFHRNLPDAVRMLTHRDYALTVAYVSNAIVNFPAWEDVSKLKLRAVMRRGGRENTLVHEAHRLREMYKLPDSVILQAFQGIDSTLPEWSADGLEQSWYNVLLGTPYPFLGIPVVRDAYGYNAMTKVMATTPMATATTGLGQVATLAPSLRENATVYEYDKDGLYLGSQYWSAGARYIAKHANCALIEPRSGKASKSLSYVLGNDMVPLKKAYGYRLYQAHWTGGVVDETTWVDVTDDATIAKVDNGVVSWLHNPVRRVGLVLFNDIFLGYDFTLNYADKSLSFAVTHTWPTGGLLSPFPLGQIELIMNQRSLIPGLDYFGKFPRFVVVNKEYINQDGAQNFTLRCTGYPQKDLTPQPVNEGGWMIFNQISANDVYNLRDDRTVRCILRGRVVPKETLVFTEDLMARAVPAASNGDPYHISNVMASVREVNDYETYPLRDASVDLDKRLSAYLTAHRPQPDLGNPAPIADKYVLYSPFLCKLINDIRLKVLVIGNGWQSDQNLDKIITPYKWWLDFDPAIKDEMDWTYIEVHPHNEVNPIAVTAVEYAFLNRVIALYLSSRVQLSGHLTIKQDT
ncbi:putative virion structural protein [Erwinia phage vB_EamM_Desertfox]|uniref:Putative virion structural protein n=3 Tax=Agricanvirus TaxID=1984776 RepID=A0A173GDB6_9CAUD|nr:putative virion structural protein [Erwinia phage vB_EamM_Deimos-Minion]YP_009605968.1 putative virion structural protein [Erwinia phage vB_EamM_Simmy50]YP_009621923.1 putative virion structural protein [Erwinia phage vB_EamM_Desertfox]ANH51646.1 putative virion structural protein [Erwinia phage vB_EamM_Simmy50]ANH52285.1 putative virion structural protein [Erwinia phage vB_EamM_Deimos-Minion]AUG86289.1 putative virion structural protein [Erwinia phage vB_EamM_Desertfox]